MEYELAKTASHTEYTVGHFRDYLAHVSKSLDSKLNPFQAKKIIDTYAILDMKVNVSCWRSSIGRAADL